MLVKDKWGKNVGYFIIVIACINRSYAIRKGAMIFCPKLLELKSLVVLHFRVQMYANKYQSLPSLLVLYGYSVIGIWAIGLGVNLEFARLER